MRGAVEHVELVVAALERLADRARRLRGVRVVRACDGRERARRERRRGVERDRVGGLLGGWVSGGADGGG